MSRKNIAGLKDCLFKSHQLENIQILNISTRFYEDTKTSVSKSVSHVKCFAMGVPVGQALSLDMFCKWCNSQGDTFNKNDIISIATFEAFSRYSLRGLEIGDGLYKEVNGIKYFFCVYRNKETGFIYGTWLEYTDEVKNLLSTKIITKDEHKQQIQAAKEKQLKRLAKELGIKL